ncbi:ribonuclease HII [Derxia gummosa]|uniref:Ribonuclease HII n=1 Tax=Derxia gummosa DSM 723 TaxID=1121388 RepID=A0A8B6XAU6_9BURK|nr:ribonuclease HII [Derxia gummosa]
MSRTPTRAQLATYVAPDFGPDVRCLCGVDEAGRGPLAGSVVAAAVVLDAARPIPGLADSKAMSEKRREALAPVIRERALAWCVAEATVEEIDRLNILQATFLAMRRAVAGLVLDGSPLVPDLVAIDGNQDPRVGLRTALVVKGDALVPSISAASILAKTARDAQLRELAKLHPEYGFERHKGYGTVEHMAAIRRHGVLPAHRRSFAPIAQQALLLATGADAA